MDPLSLPTQPDVVTVPSEPRPTPSGARFSEVMATSAGSVVAGAESAMTVLPGSPLVALAVRGGTPPGMPPDPGLALGAPGLAMTPGLGALPTPMSAEGPGGSTVSPGSAIGGALAAGLPGALMGDGGLTASLMQSQQMNLYYLKLQQEVDAQNRSFSTLSNVLKSQNDTEKNAIGNMH
jgi:hypothetical protein